MHDRRVCGCPINADCIYVDLNEFFDKLVSMPIRDIPDDINDIEHKSNMKSILYCSDGSKESQLSITVTNERVDNPNFFEVIVEENVKEDVLCEMTIPATELIGLLKQVEYIYNENQNNLTQVGEV